MPNLPQVKWNLIKQNEFEARVERVFSETSSVLSSTLGPYGATTIIERVNEYRFTKDGWNVLKSISFDNLVENNIIMLLINIAQQVVRKVGDGSTSSVVAASHLLKDLRDLSKTHNLRPKLLQDKLNTVVSDLVKIIQSKSTPINRSGDFSDIYDLAIISTNENFEISGLIKKAYQEIGAPNIKYAKSRTAKNELEIVDGYQSKIAYLDKAFVNVPENNTGDYSDINVLLFDHLIEREYHLKFIDECINESRKQNRKILIIAPHYDQAMLETFKYLLNNELKAYNEFFTISTRAHLLKAADNKMYQDLSALVGAQVITENVINEYNRHIIPQEEREKMYNTRIQGEVNDHIDVTPTNYIGRIGHVSIGDRLSLFREFVNIDETRHSMNLTNAKDELIKQQKVDEDLNLPGFDAVHLAERFMRLNCKVAIVKAGGASTLEKEANYDLLEDAVKACEAAFNDGVNKGGNLIIVEAVNEYIKNADDIISAEIANTIKEAFVKVYRTVFANADMYSDEAIDAALEEGVQGDVCYNIITNEYDGKVINPTATDVEILKGAISIVTLLITSNQYLSQQALHNLPNPRFMDSSSGLASTAK